ncbi:MAG: cysteine--tRNA ligase [Chloroflexi bacterium]|nr:cysteine--tRNA ligase [Chloroflexota bacterium]
MKVFNTLSGQKEEFIAQDEETSGNVCGVVPYPEVKMYVCGINPYADSHIGHALSYITFDVVRRYLEFRGYKVKHVENVTDVEDNIIATANRLGIPLRELTEKYTVRYFEDMDALNILRPHIIPRATEEIPKIIEVTKVLIDKGYAYPSRGDVYFRVTKDPDYGKLSKRNLESMVAGIRIELGEGKEHPMDFVLWKASKPGEPSWDSPWGPGRPGWHIECTAMSLKYLGETIDIHGGGQDLVFPHHENEIAQSESFTGKKPFVRYWLHNGLLRLGENKMSKSLGNLITIREALAKHSADALRIFVLSSYYRVPLTFTEEALEAAEKGADRLRQVAQLKPHGEKTTGQIDIPGYHSKFVAAMDDDFGTAQALATLFDLARDINRLNDEGCDVTQPKLTLTELTGVLGLTLKPREEPPLESAPFIELLVSTRQELRKAKQFQLADGIRNKLTELGIGIEDTPSGTVWKAKR